MTYKQIEASREARLWIGQIAVPVLGFIGMVVAIPDNRRRDAEKIAEVKNRVKLRKRGMKIVK